MIMYYKLKIWIACFFQPKSTHAFFIIHENMFVPTHLMPSSGQWANNFTFSYNNTLNAGKKFQQMTF